MKSSFLFAVLMLVFMATTQGAVATTSKEATTVAPVVAAPVTKRAAVTLHTPAGDKLVFADTLNKPGVAIEDVPAGYDYVIASAADVPPPPFTRDIPMNYSAPLVDCPLCRLRAKVYIKQQ